MNILGLVKVLAELDADRLNDIGKWIKRCSGTIYTVGNGGSASTAEHAATGFAKPGTDLVSCKRSVCLSSNSSLLTAWANDRSYDESYADMLPTISNNDILICISVSGNSANILNIVSKFLGSSNKAKIVGLLGSEKVVHEIFTQANEARMKCMFVDSNDYGVVEVAHLAICHIWSDMLKR